MPVIVKCFELLLEILLTHVVVVAAERLHDLLAVLIDRDRLAEVAAAALIGDFV